VGGEKKKRKQETLKNLTTMKFKELINKVIELVETICKVNEELVRTVNHDRVCGGWVAEYSDHVAIIVAMNTGYMATVYYRAKLAEQVFILPKGDTLEINGCAGTKPAHILFDPERQTLMLGRYGLFRREHEVPGSEVDILELLPEQPDDLIGVSVALDELFPILPLSTPTTKNPRTAKTKTGTTKTRK
jgi:hypothetical protein